MEEYAKLFKEASMELKELENVDRLYKEPSKEAGDVRFTVKDLSLENLLNAFAGILHKVELRKLDVNSPRQIKKETFSVKGKMLYIRDLLMEKDETYFFSLFEEDASANEVVVTFSALLELMKLQFIKTEQPDAFGDIKIVRNKENTGEIIIDYDESI
ncbi:MAG: segregation and condensation protein A [Christensenellales bacterium]